MQRMQLYPILRLDFQDNNLCTTMQSFCILSTLAAYHNICWLVTGKCCKTLVPSCQDKAAPKVTRKMLYHLPTMLYSMTLPYNFERSNRCLICLTCSPWSFYSSSFVTLLCIERGQISSSLQQLIPSAGSGGYHLFKMLRHPLILHLLGTALLLITAANALDNGGNPSGSSVNIINALNDTLVLHCSSKDNDFGQVAVNPKGNYYWKFDPNIFGRTVYNCEFLWASKRQEFPVWQGSFYDERPKCCARGPCAYKISPDGIYYGLVSDTDDGGAAESWEFYKAWLSNPVPAHKLIRV